MQRRGFLRTALAAIGGMLGLSSVQQAKGAVASYRPIGGRWDSVANAYSVATVYQLDREGRIIKITDGWITPRKGIPADVLRGQLEFPLTPGFGRIEQTFTVGADSEHPQDTLFFRIVDREIAKG